ncbi:MAG: hypothetical protein GXP61_04690 [Epsilonproteobacteria bacterium]|nr:hypothetical protein [Campylobacterota bacterium]
MDNFSKLLNDTIIDAKSSNKTLKPLKKMLQMQENELFSSEDLNYEDLGYLLKVIPYKIDDTNKEYIDNAIEIFETHNPNILQKNDIENLREELQQRGHETDEVNRHYYIGLIEIDREKLKQTV